MNPSLKSQGRLCAILAVVALAGCREITTTTRISPDGSCERTIACSGDSADVHSIFKGPFPLPVDSTWTITQKTDSTTKTTEVKAGKTMEKKNNHTTVAAKRFESVADLNRLYRKKWKDSLTVEVEVRLDKRFRWFNTFFEYRETYKACSPYTRVKISDFLTPRELSLYYMKEDTLGLDKKVDQWLARCYFEEVFQAMTQSADSIRVPGLDSRILRGRKDSLFSAFKGFADQKLDNPTESQKTMQFLEGFFHNKGVWKWSEVIGEALKGIEKKQEFLMNLDSDSYVNRVIMPGLILDTNASSVEGATVEWKLKSNRFYWEDYVMRVESRAVNRWAIWVTAALLLGVLAALAVLVIRRK
jgi:hypothetical protein